MNTDTKPQHSPTPWIAREFSQDIEISAPGFREVALVRRIYPIGGECPTACRVEQIANAAHIVACVNGTDARTMALVEALLRIEGGGCVCAGDDHRDDCHVMVARAALAKT